MHCSVDLHENRLAADVVGVNEDPMNSPDALLGRGGGASVETR